MKRSLAVLRPEPGNTATAARIEAAGYRALRLPLFAVHALDWAPPAPADFDALLMTSANTLSHGGPGLATLRGLPVLAVGATTATAARAAGFDVMLTGDRDAGDLMRLARDHGVRRALHLGGRDLTPTHGDAVARTIPVYASDALPIATASIAALDGTVALLHSARAARRLGELIEDRTRLRLAVLSPAVGDAAGGGWDAIAVAAAPTDAALIAAAVTLAD